MTYLVLNFSGNTGKTESIKRMLRTKLIKKGCLSPDELIESYDLTEQAKAFIALRSNNPSTNVKYFIDAFVDKYGLLKPLNQYEEIIIAAHGLPETCESCFFVEQDWEHGSGLLSEEIKPLLSYDELANFLFFSSAQNESSTLLNINLLICYGARTAKYTQNHLIEINSEQAYIQESFAGKLLNRLAILTNQEYKISLKAYITGVKADGISGKTLCYTEEFEEKKFELQLTIKLYNESPSTYLDNKLDKLKDNIKEMEPQANYGLVIFHYEPNLPLSVNLSKRQRSDTDAHKQDETSKRDPCAVLGNPLLKYSKQ